MTLPKPRRAPSNTYTLAERGILASVVLAALAVVVAFEAPHSLAKVCELFATLGMGIAALGGIGSSALAYRDASTGGLTSSQSHRVVEARRSTTTATVQSEVVEPTPTSPETS